MTSRTEDLLAIRPNIASAKIYDTMGADELFQNKTLRPIIKLQHNLLIAVFKNYSVKHKNVFSVLSLQKQLDYIDNAIHKDMKYRNSVKGMIIGQFTVEEYALYIQNSSAINKRMMTIVKERLINSIQIIQQHLSKGNDSGFFRFRFTGTQHWYKRILAAGFRDPGIHGVESGISKRSAFEWTWPEAAARGFRVDRGPRFSRAA